jgi:DNA-directed DNA polymerase III PolC
LAMLPFVHLHVHSDYSPMEGVSSLAALCEAARAQGADTLALTDTNGLYGAIRFLEIAKETGLRPILGAELRHGGHRVVLLAKNADGYANLCRVLSARHCDEAFDLIAAVDRYRDGLIILSDDQHAMTAWKHTSPEDLYVELTPGAMMHDALAFSRRANLPPAATNRVHFVDPRQFHLHRLLRAIALNTTLCRIPSDACCAPTHWLASVSTLERYYPHVPHALANTRRIAEQCRTDWDFRDTIFPAFRQLTDEGAFRRLQEKTFEGAAWRYGLPSPSVNDRIEHELAIIRQKRFAHYFLVVEEIVRAAPRTCGRGSVAASIVSYCLGITHVDPLKHHLFFERFLNPGRHDPPDIDIDFPWDERDGILDRIFAQYEAQRVAMVANQNSLGFRAAVREVAKVYGMPPAEIDRMAPRLMRQIDLLELAESPVARGWIESLCKDMTLKAPWPEILDLAVQAEGHFRHLSLHSGGIVIVPDEIRRYVPVEVSAKGLPVIQWEKDQTEDAGLVKIDILGNRSLAVIRDALAAIARNTGRQIDYRTWDPIPDALTQELIRRGDSIGCFYIESPATRLLLRKLWTGMPSERRAAADVFEYLVIVSSLVRPAAISFVHDFVRRAHGDAFDPLHPVLQEVLAETYGIMVYQEDVTKVAMALAGFSVEDADQLRKIISKKHKQKQLRDYCRQFYTGAEKSGASRPVVDRIWAMIMSFAGYSFCKPHSASYAQVSFKSAYLRAHYPAEFMAAVISNEGGYYSAFAYLSEARRMGLVIRPPDVNASDWTYTGSGTAIRAGLMQVKTLARALVERLVRERSRGGPFLSFHDFFTRVRPEPAQARTLIRAGCCDSIAGELTRPALLWRLQDYRERHVYESGALINTGHGAFPIPEEYSANQKLQHEIETLGFPLSRHPLDLYRSQLERIQYISASDMARHVGRTVTMIGWLVTEKMAQTKDGDPMEFITLEDTTALYDATLFPAVYRRVCQLLATEHAYVLHGRIEEQFGVATLTIENLRTLKAFSFPPPKRAQPFDGRHGKCWS